MIHTLGIILNTAYKIQYNRERESSGILRTQDSRYEGFYPQVFDAV